MVNKDLEAQVVIPILTGPSNWTTWFNRIRDYIDARSSFDLLSTNEPPEKYDGEEDRHHAKRTREWSTEQRNLMAVLRTRLSPGPRAKLVSEGHNTVKAALEFLFIHYRPKGSSGFQDLMKRWDNLTLAKCKDVNDFATQLRTIHDELYEMDKSCKMREPYLVLKFLQGLGPDYSQFWTSFNQSHLLVPERDVNGRVTRRAITLDEVQAEAETEEQHLKRHGKRSDEILALKALIAKPRTFKGTNTNNKRPRDNSKSPTWLPCSVCHTPNHSDSRCWKQHPDKYPSKDSASDTRANAASAAAFLAAGLEDSDTDSKIEDQRPNKRSRTH